MSDESTGEKYERLREEVQNLVLKAYPNPERKGCSSWAIAEYARRVSEWEDVEADTEYQHMMHCSPCYAEFLAAREELRAVRGHQGTTKRLSRKTVRRMDRALNVIEKVLKAKRS